MSTVTITSSLKYGYDNKYTEFSKTVAELFELSLEAAKKFMKLPLGVSIELRPLRKAHGLYNHRRLKIVVDPRRGDLIHKDMATLLTTLAHELVHAEQFAEGRFSVDAVSYQWNGQRVKLKTSYDTYMKQPWEVEAFGRQEEVKNKIIDILAEELGV